MEFHDGIPSYEFIMWENCCNKCDFCFQTVNRKLLTREEKKESIKKVCEFIDKIKDDRFNVLLVGGELMDDCTLFFEFKVLIDLICDLIKNGKIDIFYLNTNLLFKRLDILEYICKTLDEIGLSSHFRLTTSYDIKGRFKTVSHKELWFKNVSYIHNKYKCLIMVNCILTKELCDSILNDDFNDNDILSVCTYIHYLPYIEFDPLMTASRDKIFKTLIKINDKNPGYLKYYIQNFDKNRIKLLYKYKDGDLVCCASKCNECGHSVNFMKYSNHKSCYICDIKNFFGDVV